MRPFAWLLLIILPIVVACKPIQPEAVANSITTTSPSQEQTGQPNPTQTDVTTSITPQAALERLFIEPLQAEAWFNKAFLNAVPEGQIAGIIAQLTEQLGALQAVEGETNPYTLVFELGTLPATIVLTEDGLIETIFLEPATFFAASVEEAVGSIDELPGEVSVLAIKNGEEVASLNADTPFAVGSAYKLAVLTMLRRQIEAGLHTWDEVVPLAPEWKAPPGSQLRDWPDNSPMTLHTLATLMISISDNTAADALLHIVGREEIETIAPNSRPLLTTQELFKLKAQPNADQLEAYRAGDEAAKRQVLEILATAPQPRYEEISTTPIIDIEWFFTAYELCELINQVQDLPLMSVTPGPASSQPERWSRIAFKGGSELGVLNLTTWLETPNGDSYCVTMTQNKPDGPIDEAQFVALYRSLVAVLE